MGNHKANWLLAELEPEDFGWLEPELEEVALTRGMLLAEEGKSLRHAYFPHDAVVSLMKDMEDGRSVEMAAFGRSGIVGISCAGIPLHAVGRYVVQVPGEASRISLRRLDKAVTARPGIQQLLHRYTEVLMVQTLQSVACNAAHSVEARFCRRILRMHALVGRDTLPLTHDVLAATLGLQRSTVSLIARKLQAAGLIHQGRGTITITDRRGLEEATCECYAMLGQKMAQLLPRSFKVNQYLSPLKETEVLL